MCGLGHSKLQLLVPAAVPLACYGLFWLQGVTKTSRKERLAAKFVEAEFEKVDRLMEVAFRSVCVGGVTGQRLGSWGVEHRACSLKGGCHIGVVTAVCYPLRAPTQLNTRTQSPLLLCCTPALPPNPSHPATCNNKRHPLSPPPPQVCGRRVCS